MPESRQYELIYVVAPDVGDDDVAALHTKVDGIVTAGDGEIEKTDNWGRRRLAYEIGRYREGTYVLELFHGPGELVGELERQLKVTDNVLRFLIVRVDEDLRKAERARTKRQTTRQRRRDAKGTATVPPVSEPAPSSEATDQPAPVAPDTPTVPDASKTPDTPTVPDASKTPDTPTVPDAPKTPDTPTVPDAPKTPDAPTVPGAPKTPEAEVSE